MQQTLWRMAGRSPYRPVFLCATGWGAPVGLLFLRPIVLPLAYRMCAEMLREGTTFCPVDVEEEMWRRGGEGGCLSVQTSDRERVMLVVWPWQPVVCQHLVGHSGSLGRRKHGTHSRPIPKTVMSNMDLLRSKSSDLWRNMKVLEESDLSPDVWIKDQVLDYVPACLYSIPDNIFFWKGICEVDACYMLAWDLINPHKKLCK